MSQIFYESDNLTIIGWYGYFTWACQSWGVESQNENWVPRQRIIRLHFTIHVNGRLRTFFQEYPLAYAKDFGLAGEDSKELTLENFSAWYAVLDVLRGMWYANDLQSFRIREWCQWATSID